MSPRDTPAHTWEAPPLSECDEERIPVAVDPEHIISIRRVLWSGQLVGYAIVYSRRIADRWIEMVSIDTFNHGCVHRHDGDHAAPFVEIRPIRTQEDVQQSFHDAYDEVYNVLLRAMGLDLLR